MLNINTVLYNEIEACPFCGCIDVRALYNSDSQSHFVLCDGCGARGTLSKDLRLAVESWNDVSSRVTKDYRRLMDDLSREGKKVWKAKQALLKLTEALND